MIMEILILFQAFLLGWVCHAFYVAFRMRRVLKQIAKENGMTLEQMQDKLMAETESEVSLLKVPSYFTEKLNDSIMLYSKDTGKFMGQAKTVEELAENLYKFEKIKYAVVNHDSLDFWFVEGKIRKDIKETE
jgi:hypothetical protein